MAKALTPITPLERYGALAKKIGVADLYFKREDLHPYGSHKGRSIPVMIDHYRNSGDRHFAISSSGNAGIAAALHVRKLNATKKADPIELEVFIGQHAEPHKAERLKALVDGNIRVFLKERPKMALQQAVTEGARSLRQSTDDVALEGYKALAQELMDVKGAGAIFIGTSSGTTAQALAQNAIDSGSKIQIHIVQTSSCHPMAEVFETYDGPEELSVAGAITDIVAIRKDKLLPLINKTGGRGWIVTNEEIEAAQDIAFKYADLDISTNSALSVAGLMKAVALGFELNGSAICMITGE